jgi:predicted HTH transcriptional regulator
MGARSVEVLTTMGEGPTIEFKESFRRDSKTGNVNKELSKVVVKTIAAFLNTNGGSLLIGVADNGAIIGIEADIDTLSLGS